MSWLDVDAAVLSAVLHSGGGSSRRLTSFTTTTSDSPSSCNLTLTSITCAEAMAGKPRDKKHYTATLRIRVATAFSYGISAAKIAEREGISQRAVHGIVARYKHQEDGAERPRSGRAKLLSDDDRRRVFEMILDDPLVHPNDMIRALELKCTSGTLTKMLRDNGFPKRPNQHTKLTPEQVEMRRHVARTYVSFE